MELVKDVGHNVVSALVTGSDEDGLIIQPTLNNMNYDTHVGNDLNVNLPTSNNSKYDLETRPLHKLD